MRDSAKLHQAFFRQFPDGVLVLDSQGLIIDMNARAECLLGWTRAEIYYQSAHDIICPPDGDYQHPAAQCSFAPEQLLEMQLPNFETWWATKEGVYLNVDVRLSSVFTDTGEQEYLLIFSDCSNERFSDSEIKNLSLFAELNPAPILQLDREAVIYYANPSMTDLMVEHGFDDEGFSNILPHNLQYLIAQCLQRQENILNIESHYEDFYFTWNFHPVLDQGLDLVQVYGLDISERKLYEKRLFELKQLAEEHSQQKSSFLANMSHELRAPMNGIIGLTQLLKETELDPVQFDFANKVSSSADALLLLINDILDISKIEAGKLEINQARYRLRKMVLEIINIIAFQAGQKRLNVDLRIDPNLPDYFIGDSLRIGQIVLNFLTNAVKFSPEQGQVFLNVQVLSHQDSTWNVEFQVTDNGPGIEENKQAYVFGKFNQVTDGSHVNTGGTGLGLAISKELAELMQGEVGLQSEVNQGACFWLRLPLLQDSEIQDRRSSLETNQLKFALIGADHTAVDIISEQLQFWDCQIVEQVSLKSEQIELLNTSRTEAYEVLNNLPSLEASGVELLILSDIIQGSALAYLLKHYRRTHHNLKVLAIGNNLMNQWPEKLHKLGVNAYLYKPYLSRHLARIIDGLFNPRVQCPDILSISWLKQQEGLEQAAPEAQENIVLKILVAEDNAINQQVAKAMLKKLGCDVSLAKDGLEAIKLCASNHYDLVFMDCNMPILDGYQATQKIREQNSHQFGAEYLPIIALTANSKDEVFEQTQEAGMDDLITKPISLHSLKQILAKRKDYGG